MIKIADNKDRCPECGSILEHDEVNIGVGVQQGPGYCTECGYDSAYKDKDEEVAVSFPDTDFGDDEE